MIGSHWLVLPGSLISLKRVRKCQDWGDKETFWSMPACCGGCPLPVLSDSLVLISQGGESLWQERWLLLLTACCKQDSLSLPLAGACQVQLMLSNELSFDPGGNTSTWAAFYCSAEGQEILGLAYLILSMGGGHKTPCPVLFLQACGPKSLSFPFTTFQSSPLVAPCIFPRVYSCTEVQGEMHLYHLVLTRSLIMF